MWLTTHNERCQWDEEHKSEEEEQTQCFLFYRWGNGRPENPNDLPWGNSWVCWCQDHQSPHTHYNTFPAISPLPFHPKNLNIQCSWCAASCCHPSDDHWTSFFLSESNVHCCFVTWNIIGFHSSEKSINQYKYKKMLVKAPEHSIWAKAEGHANTFIKGPPTSHHIYTTRESTQLAYLGQCIHLSLLPVWKISIQRVTGF